MQHYFLHCVAVAKVSKCICSGSKGTEYAEARDWREKHGHRCQVCYSTPGRQVKSCLCAVNLQNKNKWPFGEMLGSLHLYTSWVKTRNIRNCKFQCWQFLFQFYLTNIALKGRKEKERRKDKGGGASAQLAHFSSSVLPLYLTLCGIQLPSAWQVETTGS